jgi:uncharacterized membrane protein YuzA (DUF378 family)
VKEIYTTALVLLIIGGINWGLVGFFDYNLVDALFGKGGALARVIYALVGVAAIYVAYVAAAARMPAAHKPKTAM